MAGIPATFGGYPFDPDVYGSFIDQEPTFTDNIIASQVVASDQSMADLLDNGGTVGTIRFYNPPDPEADPPLARDGDTDNTPVETAGGKQSWIRIDRMKAWKAKQLTREITAAEPMRYLARTVGAYWRNYWQGLMIKIAGTVTGLTGLESHVINATNGVTGALLIDGQQAALGDFANKFGLIAMHSKIVAEYKKMGLIDYNRFTITNVLQREVELPTLNGLIVLENDRGTFDNTNYSCFLFGAGAFLTAEPRVITPDFTDYDPETDGGTDKLYTNRSMILHPNGVSFKPDAIAKQTPTDTELATATNWDLRYNAKNVRIAKLVIPASQLDAGDQSRITIPVNSTTTVEGTVQTESAGA